eukprot:gene10701-11846_t
MESEVGLHGNQTTESSAGEDMLPPKNFSGVSRKTFLKEKRENKNECEDDEKSRLIGRNLCLIVILSSKAGNQDAFHVPSAPKVKDWKAKIGMSAVTLLLSKGKSGNLHLKCLRHNIIILLAVFGPNYECLWADVETNGRAPGGTIWQKSHLERLLDHETNEFNLTPSKRLPGRNKKIPYVLTGDDAFGLKNDLMKP